MTECDEWEGALTKGGYGVVYVGRVDGKSYQPYVHRLVWMNEHGHIDPDQVVLHACDNRKCINLSHLSVGTQADNLRDMVSKGRHWLSGRTHCDRGHKFTRRNNKNVCQPCLNRRKREHLQRKKEQAA